MNTTPEQLRVIADIIEGNKPFEVRRFHDHQWRNPGLPIQWYIADNRMQAWEIRQKPLDFAPIPDGAERHNPTGLTPEQVGEGYRLLVVGEPVPKGYQWHSTSACEWQEALLIGTIGKPVGTEVQTGTTLRTPLSTPYPCGSRVVDGKLVKPWKLTREIPGFRPLRDGEEWHGEWLEEDLPEGWRPLLVGEIPLTGDLLWKHGVGPWVESEWFLPTGISGEFAKHKTRRPLPEPAPEPAKVQLGPEDWMKDGPWWIRVDKSDKQPAMVIGVGVASINFGAQRVLCFKAAMTWERSNDGINWTPCYKLA